MDDCPDLELVLPARKEAVENDFLAEMRAAARLAIYRAMAADPNPRPAFEDWTRAREAGIEMAPPSAVLRPWRPSIANVDDWRDPPKLAQTGSDTLVMDCEAEPPEAQTLWRAAERNGIAPRLFEPDRRLEGYDWYDGLRRATGIAAEITLDGKPYALDDAPLPERTGPTAAALPPRPDAIRIELAVRAAHGPANPLVLPADLAFAGEAWSWLDDALPLVTARQRAPAPRARGAAQERLLLAVGRGRGGQLRDPARPLRRGRAAFRDAAAAVGRRRMPAVPGRGGAARADVARTRRPRRRHPHPPSRGDGDARRRRGGRAVTKAWTVQLAYAAYFGATVTVEAETLEDAIPAAIRCADDTERWKDTDHVTDPFCVAACEGADGDPWNSRDARSRSPTASPSAASRPSSW